MDTDKDRVDKIRRSLAHRMWHSDAAEQERRLERRLEKERDAFNRWLDGPRGEANGLLACGLLYLAESEDGVWMEPDTSGCANPDNLHAELEGIIKCAAADAEPFKQTQIDTSRAWLAQSQYALFVRAQIFRDSLLEDVREHLIELTSGSDDPDVPQMADKGWRRAVDTWLTELLGGTPDSALFGVTIQRTARIAP